MITSNAKLVRAVAAAAVMAATLPVAANASTVVDFTWVPISENPTTGFTNPANPTSPYTTPHGTLVLTLPSFTLGGPSAPPNLGPYYSSGTAGTTAEITAFSYTAGDGLTVSLSNVTTETFTGSGATADWVTSGLDLPATGAQAPSAPTSGYYLVDPFTLSGTTAQGSHFMIGNAAGTPGAIYGDGVHASGIGNGTNTFNAAGTVPAIADGGYWKLTSITTVPLPAALPLLLGGLGFMGRFSRRRT